MATAHIYAVGIIRHGTRWEELLDALEAARPSWYADALCREPHPGVDWFPGPGQSLEPARAVCRRCLVQEECLGKAVEAPDLVGVWGGTTKRERDRLRNVAG